MAAAAKRKSPSKGRAAGKRGKRKNQPLTARAAMAAGTLGFQGAIMAGGLGMRGMGMLGGVVGRYPTIAGGAMAFAVVFSFVAVNAIWQQPGAHPHPFFRTRDPGSDTLIGRQFFVNRSAPADDVTTFRIEREADQPVQSGQGQANKSHAVSQNGRPASANQAANTQAKPANAVQNAPAGTDADSVAAIIRAAVPSERPPVNVKSLTAAPDPVAAAIMSADRPIKTASTPKKPVGDAVNQVTLVSQIQQGLNNIAFATTPVNGVAGDSTKTAIRRFQKFYQMPEDGEPSSAVLKKLKDIGAL